MEYKYIKIGKRVLTGEWVLLYITASNLPILLGLLCNWGRFVNFVRVWFLDDDNNNQHQQQQKIMLGKYLQRMDERMKYIEMIGTESDIFMLIAYRLI